MDIQLFGPVEVWHAGERVDIGHAKQRCVLAVLLMHAGQAVPVSALIDRVWGHQPPDTALNTLYSYVARLRKVLAPVGMRLLTRSGGYLLDVDADRVDVRRFRWLLAESRASAGEDRAEPIDEAVKLRRGPALSGLAGRWAVKARQVLEEEWLSAFIVRNEVYLRQGRQVELLAPLRDLLASRPDDERLAGQLMMVLYRCGRPAEARDEYRRIHRCLAERHGSSPGPDLRDLHQRILRDDPDLTRAAPRARPVLVPAGLPHSVPGFVARRAEVAALDRLLHGLHSRRAVVITAVDGTAGVGKAECRKLAHFFRHPLIRYGSIRGVVVALPTLRRACLPLLSGEPIISNDRPPHGGRVLRGLVLAAS